MADDQVPDPEPTDGDDLPVEVQKLVGTLRKGIKEDVNSLLDERLRVNDPDPGPDPDPADPDPADDPPRNESLLEKLGFHK